MGLVLVDSAADAEICVVAKPLGDKLSWVPGAGFTVQGRVATFDADVVSDFGRYQRRTGRVGYDGRFFDIRADHGDKSRTLHCCVKVLFQLLLMNGHDVRFLWWFPDAAQGVINYRVDVDDNIGNSFDCIARKLVPHLPWCSFYFTTSCFIEKVSSIRRSYKAGAEIGSHGHYHYTFERDSPTNINNLRMSIEFLHKHGFDVHGFVMPSGKSFPGIGAVMADMGIRYTSNFGLIFDALPIEFFDGKSVYLEVPIHPVAPGNVAKVSPSLEGLSEYLFSYYLAAADHLSQSFLPLFFYGHDNDTVNIELLPAVLDTLVARFPDHALVRLDHYAAFWRERLDRLTNWHRERDGHNVAVIHHQRPELVTVAGRIGKRSWPVSVERLLASPLSIIGPGRKKPRWRDRFADRYELETVLPISALSLISHQGWKSAGYKIIHRTMRALLR